MAGEQNEDMDSFLSFADDDPHKKPVLEKTRIYEQIYSRKRKRDTMAVNVHDHVEQFEHASVLPEAHVDVNVLSNVDVGVHDHVEQFEHVSVLPEANVDVNVQDQESNVDVNVHDHVEQFEHVSVLPKANVDVDAKKIEKEVLNQRNDNVDAEDAKEIEKVFVQNVNVDYGQPEKVVKEHIVRYKVPSLTTNWMQKRLLQRIEMAFRESNMYQTLLSGVGIEIFTNMEEGFKLKLPLSPIFSGIGMEKHGKASLFTFVVRATLKRLADCLGMQRLLPPPILESQGCPSQSTPPLSISQRSDDLGTSSPHWMYVTGCPGCGLTTLALELALRLRQRHEPVLFIHAGSLEPFLSLAQSAAMTIVGLQDLSMLTYITKMCFDSDGNLSKDINVYKELLVNMVDLASCEGTCKVTCIVDSAHVYYEEEDKPISTLLALLNRDILWNKRCQTILFGRRSIYSDAHTPKCHVVDTSLGLVCARALLSKKKIELNDNQMYNLELVTGFLAKDLVLFMEQRDKNDTFENSICRFEENKSRMLREAIPLALAKVPPQKLALVARAMVMMRSGMIVDGGKMPFSILHDFMWIRRTNGKDFITPISEIVGSLLWLFIMESEGEKAGFASIAQICEHIIRNRELFGASVVGKSVEILIVSYIHAFGCLNINASSLTSRSKLRLDFKDIVSKGFKGNKVPTFADLSSNAMFLWSSSPNFPYIDGMLIDQMKRIAMAIQVTIMPVDMHSNGFYGDCADNGQTCQAVEWVDAMAMPKDTVSLLWIGLQKPNSGTWTNCSSSWPIPPKHYFVSISDLVKAHAPRLDALKPLIS